MHAGKRQLAFKAVVLAVAAAVYFIAARFSPPGFFDGFAPPEPYRWVSPPPGLEAGNQSPQAGRGSVGVRADGLVNAGSVATQDGQAQISFGPGVFARPAGTSTVTIEIKPVASFPAHPSFEAVGNVYLITASSPLVAGAQVAFRYPDSGPAPSRIYVADEQSASWISTGGSTAPPYEVAQTKLLGYFAAGYPAGAPPARSNAGTTVQLLIIIVPGLVFVLLLGLPLLVLWLRVRGRAKR